jgi:hypothetical protein
MDRKVLPEELDKTAGSSPTLTPADKARGEAIETVQGSPVCSSDSGSDHNRESAEKSGWLDPTRGMILGFLLAGFGESIIGSIAGRQEDVLFDVGYIIAIPMVTFLTAWILTYLWRLIDRSPSRGPASSTQMRIWVFLGVILLVIMIGGAIFEAQRAPGVGNARVCWARSVDAVLFLVLPWIDNRVRSHGIRNLCEAGLWGDLRS